MKNKNISIKENNECLVLLNPINRKWIYIIQHTPWRQSLNVGNKIFKKHKKRLTLHVSINVNIYVLTSPLNV